MIHNENGLPSIKSWKEWGSLLQYEHERLLEEYAKKDKQIKDLTERVEKLEQFRAIVYAIAIVIGTIIGIFEISIKL